MINSDRIASILLGLAALLMVGVGLLEYLQYDERQRVEALIQQEQGLRTRVTALQNREAALIKQQDAAAALTERLLPADGTNIYAQILMATVEAQRESGVQFPTYGFAAVGNAGRYPRYSVTGVASGTEAQVYRFIALLEEGPYRVQATPVTYTGRLETGEGPPASGNASVTVTLLYTAHPAQ